MNLVAAWMEGTERSASRALSREIVAGSSCSVCDPSPNVSFAPVRKSENCPEGRSPKSS